MPRVPELNAVNASPAIASMMAEQEAYFGLVLGLSKVMGHTALRLQKVRLS